MSWVRIALEIWIAFDIVGLTCVALFIDRPANWLVGDEPEDGQ